MPALIKPRPQRRMTFAASARRKIQQLGPYKSLAALLIPLLIVEPVKMAGVAFLGMGHWVGGLCMIGGAYAVGILFIDRLFRIVKSKIYRIQWCAWLAKKVQEHLARFRRVLQWSSADRASIQNIQNLEAKIAT